MTILKVFILVGVIISVVFVLLKKTNKWSISFRQYMIKQANITFGNSAGWERPWTAYLSKALIIFFAIMLIVILFSYLFGPIYFGCDAACQASYNY